MATALELSGRGLSPLVIERRPTSWSHPRATALTPATMQLLSRWGAEPEVRRLGFRCEHAMSIRPCIIADQYRAGRVMLAGDAAHVFTPATGMGLNLAIHDGTVLARHLADAIEHGHQPEALDQYEQACKPLAEKLLEPELAPA